MSIAKFTHDTFGGLPRHRGPSGAPSRASMGAVPPATHPHVGYMLVLGGASLFALNAGFSKVVLDAGIEPARLTTLRCTGAAVGLLLFLLATDRRRLRLDPRDIPGLIVLGLAGAALIQWLYFVALDRIPVGIALLIEFTGPLMVAVYSRVVLRHAMHRRIWLALGLALGGLALVAQIWRDVGLDTIGLAAAFGAAGCLATFHLLGKHTLRKRDPITLSFWMFAFASVFWAILQPWWNFDAGVLVHHVSLLGALSDISVPVWLPMLWVIVLGTLAPYSLRGARPHPPRRDHRRSGRDGRAGPRRGRCVDLAGTGPRCDPGAGRCRRAHRCRHRAAVCERPGSRRATCGCRRRPSADATIAAR